MARAICKSVLERLALLERHAKQHQNSIPTEWIETERIDSHDVEFALVRKELGSQGSLVVVRAFVSTWRFPNYFSLGAVGHVRADGFILAPDGSARPAPQELLWEYR